MKKIIKIYLLIVLGIGIFSLVAPASAGPFDAAVGKLNKATENTGLSTGSTGQLESMVASVVKAVLGITGTIFFVLVIWAGIMWMTSQGNEEKVGKAVKILTTSVIGLIVILSAYAITYFVSAKLGALGGGSGDIGCCISKNDPTACSANTRSIDCKVGDTANWQAGPCPATCKTK